ncbi:MAG TPA: response regulator [Gemmatimonadales bacterium]|jgi:CheY-like chemotaxis protein|nr:response regulator [Gemmatimonadales bacterium]
MLNLERFVRDNSSPEWPSHLAQEVQFRPPVGFRLAHIFRRNVATTAIPPKRQPSARSTMELNDHSTSAAGTVLIVDDEELLRGLLSRLLADAGLMVAEAPNGRVALDVVESLGEALRLVVTDIQMPVMSGPEFVREFRPRHPDIPVLYMTGRSASAPTHDYGDPLLHKPFTGEAFLALVQGLLCQVR